MALDRDACPRAPAPGAHGDAVELRLPFRAPLRPRSLFGHLAATAVPGVEEWRDGGYRRTLRLPCGTGVVALRPGRAVRPARPRPGPSRPSSCAPERWRPWRAYAVQHLWGTSPHPVNALPGGTP